MAHVGTTMTTDGANAVSCVFNTCSKHLYKTAFETALKTPRQRGAGTCFSRVLQGYINISPVGKSVENRIRSAHPTRCIRPFPITWRGKGKSATSGNENRWATKPKSTRSGRRGTLCHKPRGEVNGPRAKKSTAPVGWGDMSRRGHGSSPSPSQRQGAGRSAAIRQTFFH